MKLMRASYTNVSTTINVFKFPFVISYIDVDALTVFIIHVFICCKYDNKDLKIENKIINIVMLKIMLKID